MSDNIVQVVIQGSDQTGPALESAKQGVKAAAQEVADGAEKIGTSSREASGHLGGLGNILKEYRSEMRQENRMSRFLANDIASLGLASKGAAGEITGLVSAFAVGGGMGIAIEVVKIGIKEIAEATAGLEKVLKSIDAQFVTMEEHARASRLSTAQATFEAALGAGTDSGKKYLEIKADLEKQRAAIEKEQKGAWDARANQVIVNYALVESMQAKEEEMIARRDEIINRATADLQIAEKAAKSDGIGFGQSGGTSVSTGGAELKGGGVAALNKDLEAKKRAEKDYWSVRQKAMEDDFEAYRRMRLAEMALDDDKAQQAHELLVQEHIEGQKYYEEDQRRQKDEANAKKAEAKEMMQSYFQPLAHAASSMMNSIVQNGKLTAKAIGDAFKSMVSSILSSFIEMGAKWAAEKVAELIIGKTTNTSQILSTAPVAGAAAYASTAAIPIIGPALAPEAAMEAMGFVEGLAPIAAASGGWDMPAGGPFPMLGHSREMMLPEKHADVIRSLADGGGAGGSPLHFHGAFIDEHSVRRFLSSPEYQRARSGAQRDGRNV